MTEQTTRLLRDAENYLSALHGSVARHDNLAANFGCAGCELRDKIGAELCAVSSADPAPATDRDTSPTDWIDGHPHLEAIAAAVWERCDRSHTGIVMDDPRNIAVAALAAVLPAPTDQTDPAERLAGLRRAMTAIGADQTTPEQHAEQADADRELARRLHAVRPGVPLHHVFAVLQALRAVQVVDAASSAGRAPATGRDTLREHIAVALARENARLRATIERVRRLHDALDAETDLTSPDDEITRGAAARKIAAALDGWTDPAELRRLAGEAQQARVVTADDLARMLHAAAEDSEESFPTWVQLHPNGRAAYQLAAEYLLARLNVTTKPAPTGEAQQDEAGARCRCGATACESELCDCDSAPCPVDHAREAPQPAVDPAFAPGMPCEHGCRAAADALAREAQQDGASANVGLPARLEAALTERYTELGNPFSEMRRHEQGPDGWPASHPVGPHEVAEVLRELLTAEPQQDPAQDGEAEQLAVRDRAQPPHRALLARLEAERAKSAQNAADTRREGVARVFEGEEGAFRTAIAATIKAFYGLEAAVAYHRSGALPQGADPVITVTEAEVHASAAENLAALGLTYDQLADQAQRGEFASADAHALWVAIGGTIDPARLAPAPEAGLREQYAAAIRDAACTGDCGMTEEECARTRIQPVVWHPGLAEVSGSPEMFADAVLAVRDRALQQLRADRDRLAVEVGELRGVVAGPDTPAARLQRLQVERLLAKVRGNQQQDAAG